MVWCRHANCEIRRPAVHVSTRRSALTARDERFEHCLPPHHIMPADWLTSSKYQKSSPARDYLLLDCPEIRDKIYAVLRRLWKTKFQGKLMAVTSGPSLVCPCASGLSHVKEVLASHRFPKRMKCINDLTCKQLKVKQATGRYWLPTLDYAKKSVTSRAMRSNCPASKMILTRSSES